jgi:hypothetical protein
MKNQNAKLSGGYNGHHISARLFWGDFRARNFLSAQKVIYSTAKNAPHQPPKNNMEAIYKLSAGPLFFYKFLCRDATVCLCSYDVNPT